MLFKIWFLLWEIPSQSLFLSATLVKPMEPQILIAEIQSWKAGKGKSNVVLNLENILYKEERKCGLFSEIRCLTCLLVSYME